MGPKAIIRSYWGSFQRKVGIWGKRVRTLHFECSLKPEQVSAECISVLKNLSALSAECSEISVFRRALESARCTVCNPGLPVSILPRSGAPEVAPARPSSECLAVGYGSAAGWRCFPSHPHSILLLPLTYLPSYGCSSSTVGSAGAKVQGVYASLDGPSLRGCS